MNIHFASNPLLADSLLPAFEHILPAHVEPAVSARLEDCQATIAQIEADPEAWTWDKLAAPLEGALDRLNRTWSPISHLHSVDDMQELRDAYSQALPRLSAQATELSQNATLFARYRRLADSPQFARLDPARQQAIRLALRDFELAGVGLEAKDKIRFKDNASRLATLSNQFQENVLDASNAWNKHLVDLARLSGVPEAVLSLASAAAEREGKTGWLLNLELPCYVGVMTHADDRELREEMYSAYSTRASDQGPQAGQWDNTEVMEEILALRHEQAQLLGRSNYAELSLARKMASSTDDVMRFLGDLARRARPAAVQELATLREFAAAEFGIDDLQAHDIAYCSEKFKQARYSLSQEALRPYFPVPRVIEGLFAIVERLFGVRVRPAGGPIEVWHPDVQVFELRAAPRSRPGASAAPDGELIGKFYLDLYARPRKRGGAWMDECVVRRRDGDRIQLPVAFLTCNFTPPTDGRPALLSHEEVTTLFHEFGHGLHHLLTRVEVASVSGINGVAWDAVELPSQLMENWCWEREALDLVSGHYQTGERLPESLFERLGSTRIFQAGMQTLRQLEFAMLDFRIHLEHHPGGQSVEAILSDVRDAVSVVPVSENNRFVHGFTHIFGGGYAAGYYSYKWAEALSADAYAKFIDDGIFDPETGKAFKQAILEPGGTRDAMELFKAFRGREPTLDALMRQCGFETVPANSRSASIPTGPTTT